MSDTPEQSNLPAQIADAVTGIPKALVPACVMALDRLIGAAVDIPVAWLAQKKAQICREGGELTAAGWSDWPGNA
jgi:hypothetical protein